MKKKEFNGLMKSERTKAIKVASILHGIPASDLYIAETAENPSDYNFWDVKATIRSYNDADTQICINISCYIPNRRKSYAYDINHAATLTSDSLDEMRAYVKAKARMQAQSIARQAEGIIAQAQDDMQTAMSDTTDIKTCSDVRKSLWSIYKAGKLALVKTCGSRHDADTYIKRLRESRKEAFKALEDIEDRIYADMAISVIEAEEEAFESEMVTALKHKMISVLADMADDHRYGDMPIDDMRTYVDDTLEWSESHALLDRDEISYLKEALGEHIAHTYIVVEEEM